MEQPPTDQPQKGQPQGIAPTVGDVVGAFKSLSTNDFIRNVKQNNWRTFYKKLWQRNYFEHIIRNEKSYNQISEYIQTNPLKWQDDKYYI
jgi:REP element-mobilizing transposase RayT